MNKIRDFLSRLGPAREAVEFLCLAEAGVLEKQSRLLGESIRKFGGRYARAGITVLQPRPTRKISEEGRRHFAALGAKVVEMDMASPCPDYGTSYRVLACAEYEPASPADVLIFLDSDTVLLAEPDFALAGADVAARPVDVKGMCSEGADDPRDVYWRELCRLCAVDYEKLPRVETTVERLRVTASYNGGLTVVKRKDGVHAKTADFFLRSMRAGLVPWPERRGKNFSFPAGHGVVGEQGSLLWGSAQACFSLAVTALGRTVRVLPPSQNFPLHSYAELQPEIVRGAIPPIAHAHYHHVFRDDPRDNPILNGQPGFPAGAKEWLAEHQALFA